MDNTCAICLEDINKISNKLTFNCEHFFHKKCINNYLEISCPICKTIFINSNIYYINNIDNYHFKNIVLNDNKLNYNLTKYFTLSERMIFLKLLNKNVLISGSFLLSVIINETFKDQDLDIYIDNYSEYKLVKKFLTDCNYKKINKLIYYKSNEYKNIVNINKIITFIKNDKKIDIVFNKNNYLLIKYNFDLDIVKNYFDGKYIYVYDKTKLELKIDYISKNKLTKCVSNRIIKYRNRGFKIYITEN